MTTAVTKAPVEECSASPARFDAAAIAWALVAPLAHRLGRFEGLLLAVNVSLALAMMGDASTFLTRVLISTVVLGLLYLLNDVYDAPRDVSDPGKDARFVAFCAAHRSRLFGLLVAAKLGVVLLAWVSLGRQSAFAVGALFVVNVAYSAFFKGFPALDVPIVALWGALYPMVLGPGVPLSLTGLVGAMTAVCHVFQITRDREIDDSNRIRTSAVAASWLPNVQLALLCAAMGVLLFDALGVLGGLSAAVPLVLRYGSRTNQWAWILSKAYFAVVWLVLLVQVHG